MTVKTSAADSLTPPWRVPPLSLALTEKLTGPVPNAEALKDSRPSGDMEGSEMSRPCGALIKTTVKEMF
eukprot:590226-Hanusia_phi.AAC.1